MTSTPPQKAIGSVFPEARGEVADAADSLWRRWTGGYAHVAHFQSARAALHALLTERQVRRFWLPAYACEVLTQGVPAACETHWYGHGPGLPLTGLAPEVGDAVLGIDYFGRIDRALADRAHAQPEVLWIEDRAQALDPGEASWGDVLLYSPRKLIGVGDGGVMVSDQPLPQPTLAVTEDNRLWAPHEARTHDPDGLTPALWSPAFQAREVAFDAAPHAMQARTRSRLQSVAFTPLRARRIANYRRLQVMLPDFALWPDPVVDFAPLAFPISVQDAGETVRALAAERIWCVRHWAALPSPAEGFAEAQDLARTLVSLPCDQRYDEADMARIGAAVSRLCSAPGAR